MAARGRLPRTLKERRRLRQFADNGVGDGDLVATHSSKRSTTPFTWLGSTTPSYGKSKHKNVPPNMEVGLLGLGDHFGKGDQ